VKVDNIELENQEGQAQVYETNWPTIVIQHCHVLPSAERSRIVRMLFKSETQHVYTVDIDSAQRLLRHSQWS